MEKTLRAAQVVGAAACAVLFDDDELGVVDLVDHCDVSGALSGAA
jgi:hypothetical protein